MPRPHSLLDAIGKPQRLHRGVRVTLIPLNLIVETPGSIFKSADAETAAQLEIAGTDPSVMACLVVALIH